MAAPAVPRIRLAFEGTIGGAPWATAYWLSATTLTPPSAADLATFASGQGSAFVAGPGSTWRALNYSTTIFDSVRADWYAASSSASSVNANPGGFASAGTATNTSAASQSICTSLYTATASRRGRGRMYWPATGNLGSAAQHYGFTSTQVGTWATAFAAMLANVLSSNPFTAFGTLTPVVQSLTAGQVFPITTVLADTRPDRQEHREKTLLWTRSSATV